MASLIDAYLPVPYGYIEDIRCLAGLTMSQEVTRDQMHQLITDVISTYVWQFLSSVFQYDRKDGSQVDFTPQREWLLCSQIAPDVLPELAAHFPMRCGPVAQANHRLHDILAIVRIRVPPLRGMRYTASWTLTRPTRDRRQRGLGSLAGGIRRAARGARRLAFDRFSRKLEFPTGAASAEESRLLYPDRRT